MRGFTRVRDALVKADPRAVFLRALGVVFAIAFASLLPQLRGLWGGQGISPVARYLAAAHRAFPSVSRFLHVPTVFWLGSSDAALIAWAVVGLLLSGVLIAGFLPRPCLALLWALYLSFVSVGGVFLGFQWDTLLLEIAVCAFFYAPAGLSVRSDRASVVGRIALWLLLFKLMWGSGLVKLASGDPTWRHLTALRYHFWTQPLPGPLALWVARWPSWLLDAMTFATFVIEAAVPFAILLGRRGRRVAFAAFVLLQLSIAATGNYGFFNLLAAVLAFPLLDERPWPWRELGWPRRIAGGVLCVLIALPLAMQVSRAVEDFGPAREVLEALAPFETFNPYGLFAVMTTERPELSLEGSDDGLRWTPYTLRWLPAPGTPLRQVAPYQPRLDWQLWFAALGRCEGNPWFLSLAQRLLEGSAPVEGLFAQSPKSPPRFLRTGLRLLTPTPDGVWQPGPARPYCPLLALEGGRLVAVQLGP